MNEEELRKEATTTVEWESTPMIDRPIFINGYIVGAKPREKQIAELKDEVHTWKEAASANSYKAFQLQEESKTLSMHIVELQNDKGELIDRCRELEAHIEKMKCCYNCKQSQDECYCKIKKSDIADLSCWDYGCDKWEIK